MRTHFDNEVGTGTLCGLDYETNPESPVGTGERRDVTCDKCTAAMFAHEDPFSAEAMRDDIETAPDLSPADRAALLALSDSEIGGAVAVQDDEEYWNAVYALRTAAIATLLHTLSPSQNRVTP